MQSPHAYKTLLWWFRLLIDSLLLLKITSVLRVWQVLNNSEGYVESRKANLNHPRHYTNSLEAGLYKLKSKLRNECDFSDAVFYSQNAVPTWAPNIGQMNANHCHCSKPLQLCCNLLARWAFVRCSRLVKDFPAQGRVVSVRTGACMCGQPSHCPQLGGRRQKADG